MDAIKSRSRGRPRAFHDKTEASIVQSLDRAMDLLKTVAAGNGMSLTEIADTVGMAPATAYRALITLQKHDMVEFDKARQLWNVGAETFRIGSAFLRRNSIAEQSRPVMRELMNATGETSNLAIVERGEVVFVSQVETREPIRAFFAPGTRGPVHASGIGKALLAFLPPEEIDTILKKQSLDTFTDKTITEKEALMRELDAIRARGWAVDDEERTRGMRCIAAPIFNAFGEAVAGVSLSGPSVRVTPERDAEFGALTVGAAAQITAATGGRVPDQTTV